MWRSFRAFAGPILPVSFARQHYRLAKSTDRPTVSSRREWRKKRYAEDPEYREKVLACGRAHWKAHKNEIKQRRSHKWKTDPAFREKHYALRPRYRRKIQLKADYGLSLEEYNLMLKRQRGACAICKKKSDKTLCVDHCHLTRRVRSLLCRKCNSGLGLFEDNLTYLRAAVAYLEAFLARSAASRGTRRSNPGKSADRAGAHRRAARRKARGRTS